MRKDVMTVFLVRASVALLLFFVTIFFGITAGADRLQLGSVEPGVFEEVDPAFEPDSTKTSAEFQASGTGLTLSNTSAGTYTYVSQVYTPAYTVEPGQLEVNGTFDQETVVDIMVATSDNGFYSVKEAETRLVNSGYSVVNLNFTEADSYRYMVSVSNPSNSFEISRLSISGDTYNQGVPLGTPIYILGIFILMALAFLVILSLF
jgi:hypothetical protein